jgi:23S rRNA (uracil1939-C5)-methyltransferase
MNKSGKPDKTFEITVDKLVYGGAGLGRHEGKVVFVPFSVPGDHLLVRAAEEKRDFVRADIVRILEPGSGRVMPACPHFGSCGGCQWQQLEYSRQVEAKRQILEELFHHRFPETRDLPIVMRACAQPLGYRSRARIQLQRSEPRPSVGFFRAKSHAVEDVESCPLLTTTLNRALASIRQINLQDGYDPEISEMDMACSQKEDTWAVAPVTTAAQGGIPEAPETEEGSDAVILKREIGQFVYSVTASVFFQANDFMVSELAALVLEYAGIGGQELALDLFSGVGLFSLPLARRFRKVIAVEYSPFACRLCSMNATAAGIDNLQVVCADVEPWMHSPRFDRECSPDLVVLDPPRAGAGLEVMKRIREWAPGTVIYVSCDPQTLARDLARFSPGDYVIDLIEGLDLFPQTFHFETVVRLTRR